MVRVALQSRTAKRTAKRTAERSFCAFGFNIGKLERAFRRAPMTRAVGFEQQRSENHRGSIRDRGVMMRYALRSEHAGASYVAVWPFSGAEITVHHLYSHH